MNILFISSGNTKSGISPIVFNQGNSLMEMGHHVSFFTIKEKGLKGYVKYIFILRKFLKNHSYEIIHAHYSLSAIVAGLAGGKPIVVSLMGSDIKASPLLKYLIKICKLFFWKRIIVKSSDMRISCGIESAAVIPNGVDFSKFKQFSKKESLEITHWNPNKKHILFAANPKRKEKNFPLAKSAFQELNAENTELHTLVDIPNHKMPAYFNAADVIILTSLWEGSPNVIKEALACNCKIVAVNVGDIKEIIGNASGCFITGFNKTEIADCIKKALAYTEKPDGRTHISHLSSDVIAKKITNLYKEVL
ncbi:glycosyltransferase family 4 protein [Aquimarina sp. RZ0]|uniref:glycosyltransferase family 4 protein n=1 Tax=Aquimarina sp. RZ0 TaxID=2607730 RepID=UPI0011F158BF|nr:glycosyltransferase family 4 protein [Aquimarina sp. RZ0]KAA1244185.1 glycosyltransferase family 4 protein [Aquimarina sp. RZ0]